MFIQYLRHGCLFIALYLIINPVYAEAFKWKDTDSVTQYTQQAPSDGSPYEIIQTPPPPAVDPNEAQKEIDTLIEQQNGTYEAKQEERRLAQEKEAQEQKLAEFCRVSRHNLQEYQNNPGRQMIDADGNVTRPTEEERQQKIAEIQQQLTEHCQ